MSRILGGLRVGTSMDPLQTYLLVPHLALVNDRADIDVAVRGTLDSFAVLVDLIHLLLDVSLI